MARCVECSQRVLVNRVLRGVRSRVLVNAPLLNSSLSLVPSPCHVARGVGRLAWLIVMVLSCLSPWGYGAVGSASRSQ